MNALTYDQILSRINPFYRDDFRQSVWPLVRPNEDVIWAGNCCQVTIELELRSVKFDLGYVLVASQRLIRMTYPVVNPKRNKIHISQFSPGMYFPDPPSARLVLDYPPTISETRLQNITTIGRSNYPVKTKGNTRIFSALSLSTGEQGLSVVFYSQEDGDEVYQILQRAMQQTAPTTQQPNLLGELERLEALHKRGALTDMEFQNGKRKLGI